MLALGGTGKAALVGYGNEQAQGNEIDTPHGWLSHSQVTKRPP